MLRIELINPNISLVTCSSPAPVITFGLLDLSAHNDLDEASVSFRSKKPNDKIVETSFAEKIIFYGATAIYLKYYLIECNPNHTNSFDIRITDDCCNQVIFEGVINYLSVRFCPILDGVENECEIEVTTKEKTVFSEKYRCLGQALISKKDTIVNGTEFQNTRFRFMRYCKESRPKFFHDVFVAFFFFVSAAITIIMLPLIIVIAVISLIVSAINLLGADIDFDQDEEGNQSLYEAFQNFFGNNAIVRFFMGCGKGHPTPFIRDYILNACAQCNLSFSSTILNDNNSTWNNSVYLSTNTEMTGSEYYDGSGNIITDARDEFFALNAPNKTAIEFLDEIAKPFNAVWDVQPDGAGGFKLTFEKESNNQNVWSDFSLAENNALIKELCFTQSKDRDPAILILNYQKDANDIIGNEVDLRYNDIIKWNDAFYGGQNADLVGSQQPQMPFAMSRYRNDGVNRDVINFWLHSDQLPNTLVYIPSMYVALLIYRLIAQIDPFLSQVSDWEYWLMLNCGVTFNPKIIVINPDSPLESTEAVKQQFGSQFGVDVFYYNSPMWFADPIDLNDRGKPNITPNLWQFWESENPNNGVLKKGSDFNLTLEYDCRLIDSFLSIIANYGFNFQIKIPYSNGFVYSKTIDSVTFNQNQIQVTGSV